MKAVLIVMGVIILVLLVSIIRMSGVWAMLEEKEREDG